MNLTKKSVILFIVFISISVFTRAQTLEEIIAKHIEAHGGSQIWDKIISMEIKGKLTAFSTENDFYALKTNTGAYYSNLYLGQYKIKEAFNGKEGWTIDPWHEFVFPRQLNKSELNVFFQKAELFTPFYKYKEKGCKAALLGKENVDGVDTYVIKLTRENGFSETWYIDQNTYLEYKSKSQWVDFAFPLPCETFYDDFRTVNGLVIPFYVERIFGQRDRITAIESVKFNTIIDEDIFEMPKSTAMNKLTFLVGDWDVKIEKSGKNNSWSEVDNTISSFQFVATNNLQQTLSFNDYYVQSMLANYSFHKYDKKYRLTIYDEFTSSMDIFEGTFIDGIFNLENTNFVVNSSDSGENARQISIYDIAENNFVMEIKNSVDKGKSWTPVYKLDFSRKK